MEPKREMRSSARQELPTLLPSQALGATGLYQHPHLQSIMLFRFLLVISVNGLISSSSLLTLNPPSPNLTLPTAFPATDLSAHMNPVYCRRDPDNQTPTDYGTCIPSLFRMYTSPGISTPLLWDPGDFRQWGPETDIGGCYILIDGGAIRDVFSVEASLGPAIWAIGKCFVLDLVGVVAGNSSGA